MTRMRSQLRDSGFLVIMHDISRQQVNAIHQDSGVVRNDRLASGETVRQWLITAGYQVHQMIDADDRYFVKAIKVN